MSRKQTHPSADRNSKPILEILQKVFDTKTPGLKLLEISSGHGQHTGFFCEFFPNIRFQPTEHDQSLLPSIEAYAKDASNKNVEKPFQLDVTQDFHNWTVKFEESSFDYMMNINMIHITPIECSEGLFRNAGRLLKPGGFLVTYGPYAENGVLEPESNVAFDQNLKSRNPSWGIKDIKDLKEIARTNGIEFKEYFNMPSNNKTIVWQRI
ncbi:hypothetical protein ACFFRR_004318 [Megaselia abdita]